MPDDNRFCQRIQHGRSELPAALPWRYTRDSAAAIPPGERARQPSSTPGRAGGETGVRLLTHRAGFAVLSCYNRLAFP